MESEPKPTHATFGTTSWSMILRAADGVGWDDLVRAYRDPIHGYFRRLGFLESDADDLTQGFIARELERPRVLRRAEEIRGRFRDYLKSALRNYALDERRRRLGRSGERAESRIVESRLPEVIKEADAAFHREWAAATVHRALVRVRTSCVDQGLVDQLDAFEARVVRPAISSVAPASIEEIAGNVGVSAAQVSSMVQTIKRRFHRTLREVVLETLEDPDDLDIELSSLQSALAV